MTLNVFCNADLILIMSMSSSYIDIDVINFLPGLLYSRHQCERLKRTSIPEMTKNVPLEFMFVFQEN